MSVLHTINKAPHDGGCLAECLRICGDGASILLIEGGVLAAIAGSTAAQLLRERAARVYVLKPDADARGIGNRIEAGFVGIDYAGFVQLCCEHASVQSWY